MQLLLGEGSDLQVEKLVQAAPAPLGPSGRTSLTQASAKRAVALFGGVTPCTWRTHFLFILCMPTVLPLTASLLLAWGTQCISARQLASPGWHQHAGCKPEMRYKLSCFGSRSICACKQCTTQSRSNQSMYRRGSTQPQSRRFRFRWVKRVNKCIISSFMCSKRCLSSCSKMCR